MPGDNFTQKYLTMDNNLKIVNQHIKYKKVSLVEPSNSNYLLVAAEIDNSPLPFFIFTSAKKKLIIAQTKQWCRQLESEEGVVSAVVFKASVISPGKGKILKERPGKVQIATYDFVVLIEAVSADKIDSIRKSIAYQKILKFITNASRLTYTTVATNVKQIMPVNHQRSGVFLFNYFYADDLNQNLAVWEYSAGWFQEETGLDNSTVLLPLDRKDSKYTIINHCRWDKMSDILPSLLFKKSFRLYVLDNFYINKVAAMPILYKMA